MALKHGEKTVSFEIKRKSQENCSWFNLEKKSSKVIHFITNNYN